MLTPVALIHRFGEGAPAPEADHARIVRVATRAAGSGTPLAVLWTCERLELYGVVPTGRSCGDLRWRLAELGLGEPEVAGARLLEGSSVVRHL